MRVKTALLWGGNRVVHVEIYPFQQQQHTIFYYLTTMQLHLFVDATYAAVG